MEVEEEKKMIPLEDLKTTLRPNMEKTNPDLITDKNKFNLFLYTAAVIVNLISFASGITFAWSSPVLPRLGGLTGFNPLGRPTSPSEEAWIVGLLPLGSAVGPLAAGKAADLIGRKKTLLILGVPLFLAYSISAFANTVWWFYVARFLMGLGVGGVFSVVPIYASEISQDHNRGAINCFMAINCSAGLLFAYVAGPFLSVRAFNLVCLVPLVIFFPVFGLCVPESPQFLAETSGRDSDLQQSLRKFRLQILPKDHKEPVATWSQMIGSRGIRRGLLITLGLITLQQFAGIMAVLAYMQAIFDATGSGLRAETSAIIVGTVQLVVTVFTSSVVDKFGRRILLLISATGACLSLIALGMYFYLKTGGFDVAFLFWLPITSLLVYIVSFNLGLGPLPWTIMGEVFPQHAKGFASTATSVTCFVGSFVICTFFPALSLLLGMAGSFWFFSVFAAGAFVFIYWLVPETKGRSLQEIVEILEQGG